MACEVERRPEEEEVCDPEKSCKSWGSYARFKEKPVKEPAAFHGFHSVLDSSKALMSGTGIDEERRLIFKLQPGDTFGLDLVECFSGVASTTTLLVVAKVESGSTFAKTVHGHDGISAGDVIVSVNGRRGTAAEVRNLLQQAVDSNGHFFHAHVNIVVRPRPPAFDVEMLREGPNWETLGVRLVIDRNNPRCALVQSLSSEGLVPSWNKTHGSLQICVGDLISSVNDPHP